MTNSLVCVDASLTIKLVLYERDSELARALWETWRIQETRVVAPTLWAYEVTSVIRKQVYRGLLDPSMEIDTFDAIHQLPMLLMRPAGLHQRASELARYFYRPAAYDAHYLALAEISDCPFWTADKRLFNAVREELSWVNWLGNYQADAPEVKQRYES
jgi:predicted nucleic acid-binding protein